MLWPLRPSTTPAYPKPMAPKHQERLQPRAKRKVQRNRSKSQKRPHQPLLRNLAARQVVQAQPRGQAPRNLCTTGEPPTQLLFPRNTRNSSTSTPDKSLSTAPPLCPCRPLPPRVPPGDVTPSTLNRTAEDVITVHQSELQTLWKGTSTACDLSLLQVFGTDSMIGGLEINQVLRWALWGNTSEWGLSPFRRTKVHIFCTFA